MCKKFLHNQIIFIFVSVILVSCSKSCSWFLFQDSKTKIILRLNWTLYAEHAPFFVALNEGYYSNEGLDVEILEGSGSANTLKIVSSYQNQIGYADAGTIISKLHPEDPVKIIAVFTQTNPMAIIFKEHTHIKNAKDLIGKKIALTTGDANSTLFLALLAINNIPLNKVKFMNFSSPQLKEQALINDEVDAFIGYFIDQPPKLEHKYNIKLKWIKYSDWGINTLSSAIIVNEYFLKSNTKIIKKFIKATQLGFKFTKDNPPQAAKIYYSYWKEYPEDVLEYYIKEATTLYHTPNSLNNALGLPANEDWEQTFYTLKTYLNIQNLRPLKDYFIADFLEDIK